MTRRKPNPLPIGRPRSGNVRHTVSLPPDLWAHVDAQEGGNRSERLRLVVRRDAAVPVDAIDKLLEGFEHEGWAMQYDDPHEIVCDWLDAVQAKDKVSE
jgi:hypothetical protein